MLEKIAFVFSRYYVHYSLDQSKDTLKDHLMEELDYALLPKPAWEKLTRWYGVESNSKPICR